MPIESMKIPPPQKELPQGSPISWRITIVTPGKVYKGTITSERTSERRTLSLLNSPAKIMQIMNPAFTPNGYVQMDDVTVLIGTLKERYRSIAIKKSDIIFAYDEFKSMGSLSERKRFETWNNPWDTVTLTMVTEQRSGQSFRLTGQIMQPKEKFEHVSEFIPLTDVRIEKIIRRSNHRSMLKTRVPFVALNKHYIEAIATEPSAKDKEPSRPDQQLKKPFNK